MIRKLSELEKMILLSTAFTLILVTLRYAITKENVYLFYPWNLLLAIVPSLFSRQLKKQKHITIGSLLLLGGWLLFFPNAPYIVTDLFHFQQRSPVPYWCDLLIVTSGAWNGLALCFISLMQTERYLSRHLPAKFRTPVIISLLVLCSYGIYLGRYLRFNSWDIFTRPISIMHVTISHFIQPWQHQQFWAFTLSFAVLLSLMYFTIKKLPGLLKTTV